MTDDIILVNESGTTKMQAFTNTVGANSVKSEGVTPVDSLSVPLGTATNPVRIDPTGTTAQPVSNVQQWIGSAAPTVGQKTKANSLPVTLASDQGNTPVNIAQWIGSASPTIGQKTKTNSIPTVLPSDQFPQFTDANPGITGPFQTVPFLLTGVNLITGAPTSLTTDAAGNLLVNPAGGGTQNVNVVGPLGQTTMASSISVAIASNQSAVPIGNPSNLDVALSTRLADAKFPATAVLGDATANPTLTAVQDYQMLFNGSTWDRRRSSGVTGMAGIGGDTASAASDAGNPVKIGGAANTGLPTAVTTGQRVNLLTDVYGRPRVVDERPKLLGMYYAESGNITVLATAHTSLQGFMWLVNTSSTVIAYVRSIGFVWSGTAVTAFPTSPRITIERVTFTGTPSGATITPAKRDSTDATNTATLNTASTGLTLTAGAVIESFVVGSILTAVGAVSVPEEIWQPKDDDGLIVLRQNQGIVVRQPDNGTAADTRKIVMTLSWEER